MAAEIHKMCTKEIHKFFINEDCSEDPRKFHSHRIKWNWSLEKFFYGFKYMKNISLCSMVLFI